MRYPVIFFDLDGTLTDPAEGITKSVQYALAKFGIESELDPLRSFIGPPLHHSFMRAYGFDEPQARQAIAHYREYFSDRGIYENRMFDGIPGLLNRLREGGAALCVVTSKPAVFAQQVVNHFSIAPYFDTVVGPGLDLADAEKAVLVSRAIQRYEMRDATEFVMIGDREHDILGATANGVDSVGVTYGAGSREELHAARATHVVHSVEELEALLLT
jgi:phosphoglycolate phosphatase